MSLHLHRCRQLLKVRKKEQIMYVKFYPNALYVVGLLAAMYAGIGAGLGSLMGGVIYEKAGAHAMFYAVIGLTSLSLELYLEANTRWGISDMIRWTYRMTVRMYNWTQHVRGRGRAVPRWSGSRRTGRIRLEGDD